MYCKLLAILDTDIVTLTANQRLSQRLLEEYNTQQYDKGQIVWETPCVLPLSTHFAQLWKNHPDTKQLLLNDFQEQLIWQQVITESNTVVDTLPVHKLAGFAKQAWQFTKLWKIPEREFDENLSEEVRLFKLWSEHFAATLEANGWITAAQLPAALSAILQENNLALPKAFYLVGFEELPPATQNFFDLAQLSIPVHFIEPTERLSQPQRLELTDQEDELHQMALWAKKQFEQHTADNKKMRIACVIPDLAKIRSKVLRIFTDVFSPENNLPGQPRSELPFNLSAGQALHSFPFIQSALATLKLTKRKLSLADFSALLLSPYINSETHEACLAATLDVCLRETGAMELTTASIQHHLNALSERFGKTTFQKRWEAFLACRPEQQQQPPSEWAQYFQAQLTAMGWPGQRQLNSLEYQLQIRWNKLLAEFSMLDTVLPQQTQQEALKSLAQLAEQTLFQPQSQAVPIQILGILEASGLAFDALWLMGLDDESWPPAPQPNPFLPLSVQKKYRLPHASSARELQYAKQVQARLFSAAKTVIISSSQQDGDKRLQPSRLINTFEQLGPKGPRLFPDNISPTRETRVDGDLSSTTASNLAEIVWATRAIESIKDHQAPPISATEKLRGGSWILKQQAACPFRAFASIRLQADSLPKPEIGINAAERGIFVHRALELFWSQTKTQSTLKTLSSKALTACVENIIEMVCQEAIQELKNARSANPQKIAFLEVEKERLTALVLEWLTFEKERPAFRVISQEKRQEADIGALHLNLQVDRLDELEDGSTLLIDYKTGGNHRIEQWMGARLEEPQLPLYCTHTTPPPQGILVARVKQGDMHATGLCSQDLPESLRFSKMEATNWDETIADWQSNLSELSQAFCSGQADVDPIDPINTCKVCDLHTLCRVGYTA